MSKNPGLTKVPKDMSEILPENVELISQLRDERKGMSSQEGRTMIDANIAAITSYGDNEIFTNVSDIKSRLQADAKSARLQANYLLEKNGELSFGLNKMKTSIPSLSEITKIHDTQVFKKEVASEEYLSKFDDKEFLGDLLTQIYSHTKTDEIGLILPNWK